MTIHLMVRNRGGNNRHRRKRIVRAVLGFVIAALALGGLILTSFASRFSNRLNMFPASSQKERFLSNLSPSTNTPVVISSAGDVENEIAYAISVTSCEGNITSVVDGSAILSQSIKKVHQQSKYKYHLYAFVHPTAQRCTEPLSRLGYEVQVLATPIETNQIRNNEYRLLVEDNGCCGSKEFMKLYAYTLEQHEIVVHLDTDVMLLQPMDELFDAMLTDDASLITGIPMMGEKVAMPRKVDFFFTRDYLQQSRITRDPRKFGVQGGFFVTRPNITLFEEFRGIVLEGSYTQHDGWRNLKYGGYWGSPQIQGLLSYVYGELHSSSAVELNRCIYNTMVDDNPQKNGQCKTGTETCEDCRLTPLSDIKAVHFTTCVKPWKCPTLKQPHPERCKDVHLEWFKLRQSLEIAWGMEIPTDGWWFQRTLGYCTKKGGSKKRYYLPLQLPDSMSTSSA